MVISAHGLFFAPSSQALLFADLSQWLIEGLASAFYLLGIFVFSSVFLGYSNRARVGVDVAAAITLGVLGGEHLRIGNLVEAAVILCLALAFLLCSWVPLKGHWLIETLLWANLLIGAGMTLRPELFTAAPLYAPIVPSLLIIAILFLLSGLIGLIVSLLPSLATVKVGRYLAVPWVLWGLMFVLPARLPNLEVVFSLVLGLAVAEYLPWEKLILYEAVELGRRYLRWVLLGQSFSLALVVVTLRSLEFQLNLSVGQLDTIREAALLGFNLLALSGMLMVASLNVSVNGLFSAAGVQEPSFSKPDRSERSLWQRLVDDFMAPFDDSRKYLRSFMFSREEYETLRSRQLSTEKRRMAQLNLLHQLNLELESVLDPPVSAQLTANAIFNTLGGSLASILQYDREHEELVTLAASGPLSSALPPGHRQQASEGLVGRAARLRRTQLASDTRLEVDYAQRQNPTALSEIVVPLLAHNRLKGLIVVNSAEPHVFDDSDIRTIETVAIQLVTSWERSEHDNRLTNLIGAGITLSTTLEVEAVIQQIAEIARETLEARFVFVAMTDKNGGLTRTAHTGYAPTLLGMLSSDPVGNPLIQTVVNSSGAFRLRDVRKRFNSTPTGSTELRSLLAVPIRLRQSSIGAILVFGKLENVSFSENDVSLVALLATQAAAAIESTWLYQELRTMLATATQLYQLSIRVIQAEQLTDAAAAIAETAYQISQGAAAGIVLTTLEKDMEARVQIDAEGLHPGAQHPLDLVGQALESGQTVMISGVNPGNARVCLPLQTPRRQYGALWVQVPETSLTNHRIIDNLHTLANQAAIALERSRLLVVTLKQADELETAYHELETTYDRTLIALSSALDARDRETEGHSLRVAEVAHQLGRHLGLSPEQAKTLQRGSILHDIGKIGISDSILLKPGALSSEEWESMRLHPDIGARIIEGIPFLQDTLPVIRYHQERWDGSGYPIGLKGQEIPLLARIFAVVDAYDALTNDRPYRKKMPIAQALAFLNEKSGVLFDPEIVAAFNALVNEGLVKAGD
jgi:HD-GYP domain-containing protein (c-di-GMP phosphodiesterase class II)/GAF domain-containing protein